MSISLKQMLEGATAIPYSDTLIAILKTTSLTYKDDNKFERVDELIVGFVTGSIPNKFKSHIEKAMEEQGFQEIPTDDVFVRLAQYVVLDTILNNEDELAQTICASKLMNYMLVAKALKRSIPNRSYLLQVYDYHLSKYLEKVDKVTEDTQTELRSEVPNADFPLEISEDKAKDLCLVFKEAELYRVERLLTSDKIQNIENPFVRIYVGLCEMFDRLAYHLYNVDLNRIIGLLIGNKDERKRKKLSKIIEELTQTNCEFRNNCSQTAVILLMIKGEEQGAVGDLILPIKEFAVYLYYELLTEKILATQN
ncbi:hypothetical protein JQN09_14870 [Phocaeicola dorei]|uniref:hypothetical protein n=1 Tax=Phocaeicola dorei TaxID=357276 RepID=UPI001BDE9C71|nr:hypothetical protein [Phocaeicola dorei]MBT1308489.1 hypothetical protein [Phocaeicola dorei]MBT1313200.1 hypothetical protein [Phocaeicola dorei]